MMVMMWSYSDSLLSLESGNWSHEQHSNIFCKQNTSQSVCVYRESTCCLIWAGIRNMKLLSLINSGQAVTQFLLPSSRHLIRSLSSNQSTLWCDSSSCDCVCFFSAMVHLGTTLNLLKFPIINPTPYRMFRRQERLHEVSRQTESELSEDELRRLKHFSRQGYLVGKTGGDKGEERGPVQNQNCFYLPNV